MISALLCGATSAVELEVLNADKFAGINAKGWPRCDLGYAMLRIPYRSKLRVVEDGSWTCEFTDTANVEAYAPSVLPKGAFSKLAGDIASAGVVIANYDQAVALLTDKEKRKRCSFAIGCDKITCVPKRAIVKFDNRHGFARAVIWGDGFAQVFDIWDVSENLKDRFSWLLQAIAFSDNAQRQISKLCPSSTTLEIEEAGPPKGQ